MELAGQALITEFASYFDNSHCLLEIPKEHQYFP